MLNALKLWRTPLKLCLRSARQISSPPTLLIQNRARIEQLSTRSVISIPISKSHSNKIQLIAPHLRKANRRRRPLASLYKEKENTLPKVIGIAKADSFDLCKVFEDESFSSFYQVTFVDEDAEDALHVTLRTQYQINDATKDAFIFDDGVVVAWNMDGEELNQLTEFLAPFEQDSYDTKLVQQETETISYQYGSGPRVFINKDVINLLETDDTAMPTHVDVLDRYAISQGLAASVKIAIWEQQLNNYAEPLYDTTKLLIRGNIPWKRKESLQKTGEFAALRQNINLDDGLLNTDFYWERDNLEKHYNMTKKYFVVDKRLRELNTRLDYCQQFVNIIDEILAHQHASRLEWLIIWLIVIEVIFDLLHYFDKKPNPVYIVANPSSTEPKSPENELNC